MDGLFLNDLPRSGIDNMVIDQLMLEQCAAHGRPMLRFYQWIEPTVSLGYFQKYHQFEEASQLNRLSLVRRATGGGAIVHHHDWTYSIAIPNGLVKQAKSALGAASPLYDCMHNSAVLWLEQQGAVAQKWDQATCGSLPGECSFLCFERRTTGDVVVQGAKVMGSAQRRVPGAVLQHGSLLLARSSHAPSLAGLAELCPNSSFDFESFRCRLRADVEDCFDVQLRRVEDITEFVDGKWGEVRERMNSPRWTRRV